MSEVSPAGREALHALVEQLRLEQLEKNLFRGTSSDIGAPAVFGGQPLSLPIDFRLPATRCCRGSLYSEDGRLVASVAQEGLVRVRAARG